MYSTNMYSIKKRANKIQGEQDSWVETTESKVQAKVMFGNNTVHYVPLTRRTTKKGSMKGK